MDILFGIMLAFYLLMMVILPSNGSRKLITAIAILILLLCFSFNLLYQILDAVII